MATAGMASSIKKLDRTPRFCSQWQNPLAAEGEIAPISARC
jgi:hypothetical protein